MDGCVMAVLREEAGVGSAARDGGGPAQERSCGRVGKVRCHWNGALVGRLSPTAGSCARQSSAVTSVTPDAEPREPSAAAGGSTD